MKGENGVAILALNEAKLDISYSNFRQWNSTSGALINLWNQSNLTLTSSVVDEFTGSAISGVNVNIELRNTTIQYGTSVLSTSTMSCNKWLGL